MKGEEIVNLFSRKYHLKYFIIYSLLVILVISSLELSILRVPMIVMHIFLITLFKEPIIKLDKINFALYCLFLYVIIQSLVLGLELLDFGQSLTIIALHILFYNYIRNASYDNEIESQLASLSKILLIIIPFFLVTFRFWSDTRLAGVFSNPNITAHTAIMLFPIAVLRLTEKRFLLLLGIILLIVILTVSRSALLALLLGIGIYILITKTKIKINFLFICFWTCIVLVLSWYIVDIAFYLYSYISGFYTSQDTRLLYMRYNGRDILFEMALERFHSSPFWGLGFQGAKFQIEDHTLGSHNGALDLLLRIGIFGSSLFIILFLNILRNISLVVSRKEKAAVLAGLTVLLSLATNSSVFLVFNYYFFYFLIIYCISQNPKFLRTE